MRASAALRRAWRLRGSLRVRTSLLATVVVALALGSGAFTLVELQRRALTKNIDDTIQLRANDLEALLANGPPPATLSVSDVEESAAQILSDDGQIIAASGNVAGQPAVSTARPPAGETRISPSKTVASEPGESFRVLARGVEAPSGRYTIYVAASLDPVVESVANLTGLLRIGIPLVVAMVAVGAWWLVGRALAPVEGIRAEVARIGGRDLSRRVPAPSADDEVGRLARTMNGMLDRLESAQRREDQFVADAAHELRSPLASIRAQVEVAKLDRKEDETEILAEIDRMQRLVDDLLALSESGRAERAFVKQLIDLDDLVLREVRRLRTRGHLTVDASNVSAAAVRGDPDGLTRAVRNLLENAARHARTHIAVELREEADSVHFAVADDGDGIPPGDQERVFERFTRLDAGRARDAGGAGLGLAITRAIVEAHRGTVRVDGSYTAGARFVLRLPAAGGGPA